MNTAIAWIRLTSGSIGLGFAIPDQAKRVANELMTTGKASHGSLGVQVGTDPSIKARTSESPAVVRPRR